MKILCVIACAIYEPPFTLAQTFDTLFNGSALQNEFAIGLLPGCIGRRWRCIGMI